MDRFDLNYQWMRYLELMEMKEQDMPADQLRETKRAFYGACGQMLILLRDDLTEMTDAAAAKQLDSLINQVGNFFLASKHRSN